MKTDWKIKKLGEICDFEGGSQPPKSNFIHEPRKGYVRFLQIRDFGSDKYITYIPDSKKNRHCNEDDILLGRYGASVGKILVNKKGAYNVAVMKTMPNTEMVDKSYFYYYLISDEFQKPLSKVAARSAQAGFSKDDIYNFSVLTPPVLEQKKIVKKLDDIFEYVTKAKENAEQNLQNSKELFESYLQNVFSNPGKDWEEKKIKEIGVTQTGLTPKTANKKYYGNFVPFITPADVDILGDGSVRYDSKGLSEEGLEVGRRIKKDSVLMVCIGATIGKVGFSTRVISCNQQINTLTPFDGYDAKLFYYILSTKSFFNKVIKASSQATLPIINKGKWENLSVSFPKSISEQKAIVKKLETLSLETKKLEAIYEKKLLDLEELKKSVLRRAFNGKLK